MDWLDLFAVQGTLKSLLQHHSSKTSILQQSALFIVQLSHPYMTTGKTIALIRWNFVDKFNFVELMCLLFNMLSRLVITFLPRSKHLLIPRLQLPSETPSLCHVLSRSVMYDSSRPMDCNPPGSSVHGDSPGNNTGVGCYFLLRGIFPIQGLNLRLLHGRRILYH